MKRLLLSSTAITGFKNKSLLSMVFDYKMSRHPTAVVLPEPINVSPLIRFSRWTALGLGIVWGFVRLRQISAYHADIREWEHEKAVASAVEKVHKKKAGDKEEMRYLMKVIDMPFEEGVAQFGVEELFRED